MEYIATTTGNVLVDAYAVGYRHGRDGIKFYVPKHASEQYALRYREGFLAGLAVNPYNVRVIRVPATGGAS